MVNESSKGKKAAKPPEYTNPPAAPEDDSYIINEPIVDGQTERYVLPSDCDSCPIKACPQFGIRYQPAERVYDHMKQKHGWPRIYAQPPARLNATRMPRSSTDKRSGSSKSKMESDSLKDANGDTEMTEETSLPKSPSKMPQGAGTKRAAEDEMTPSRRSMTTRQSASEFRNERRSYAELLNPPTSDRDHRTSGGPEINKSTPATGAHPTNGEAPSRKNDFRDEAMIREIQRFIDQLRSTGSQRTGHQSALLQEGQDSLIKELERILREGQVLVNKVMTREQSLALTDVYHKLAVLAQRQAAVFSMTPYEASHSSSTAFAGSSSNSKLQSPMYLPSQPRLPNGLELGMPKAGRSSNGGTPSAAAKQHGNVLSPATNGHGNANVRPNPMEPTKIRLRTAEDSQRSTQANGHA